MIHGGFFSESTSDEKTKREKQEALKKIITDSWNYLQHHSAVETVVFAVEQLENNPLFNAGTGSQIQRDGVVRMSASIMNGDTLQFSGVINIESVKNPVRVAEKLFHFDDRVLGGNEAMQFARIHGFEYYNPIIPQRQKEYELKKAALATGTVGCVALDKNGKLAASTSTGGKGFEIPGRISDSATVAGNFANSSCAVSCTGVGEDIVSVALATKIVTRVSDGLNIQESFKRSFDELKQINGFAGAIGIDAQGNMFHQQSHPDIVFAAFDGANLQVFAE